MLSEKYGVPRAMKLDADNGLVALEWFNGKSMSDYLTDLRFPAANLQQIFVRAGTWLRHFHAGSELSDSVFDARKQLAQFDARFATSALGLDRTFARAHQLLKEKAASLENQIFRGARLHGDFKADNLMVVGDRMIGMDIQMRNHDSTLWDILPFLNRFGLLIYSPSGMHLKRSRKTFERAFLKGYFERDCSVSESRAIAWLRLMILLRQWDQRHSTLANKAIKRIANDWVYRQEAKWLCAELDRLPN
jgi:Ser/Thr protein kinase RdoA (MazF antagonist)